MGEIGEVEDPDSVRPCRAYALVMEIVEAGVVTTAFADLGTVKGGPGADPAGAGVEDEIFDAFPDEARGARKLGRREQVRDVRPIASDGDDLCCFCPSI